MGDGFWSDSAREDVRWYGIPGQGCFYDVEGRGVFWVTGGVHELWAGTGFEGGAMGAPISNFDNKRGEQQFEHGVIRWTGFRFEATDKPSDRGHAFNMDHPPAAPPP